MNNFPLESLEDGAWDKALIAKYDVSGPRYTSYPTAPQFCENYDEKAYQLEISQLKDSVSPLSVYVHIPFCQNICYYCACNKIVTKDKSVSRRYLDYLAKEIKLQGKQVGKRRGVTQLHLGGGTPTFLDNAELTELMHSLACHFKLIDDEHREYSIEIDPRTIQKDTLALLKGLGFNRVSLGVQDFDPQVQKAVNRQQSFEQIHTLTEAARLYQFKSVSYDLIYGLPYQSTQSLVDTLDKVVELSPDRIAFYNYAHLPERFKSQRSIDRLTLPSAEEKLDMLAFISSRLNSAGYLYIGMDHFVKKTDEMAVAQTQGKLQRNFQGYSTCLASDLIGLGVSSITALQHAYIQNEKDLEAYYARLDQGQLPILKGLVLSQEDELRRYVIMQIICNLKLDFQDVMRKFGIDFIEHFGAIFPTLSEMKTDGLIEYNENKGLKVREMGRPMLRNICMLFDDHLESQSTAHYSKTL